MGRRRTQYAVVYFPGDDLSQATAVGPFYSPDIAGMVKDAINQADADDGSANAAPQVVTLITLAEALEDFR